LFDNGDIRQSTSFAYDVVGDEDGQDMTALVCVADDGEAKVLALARACPVCDTLPVRAHRAGFRLRMVTSTMFSATTKIMVRT
jgi:hypothetical protein